MIHPILKTLLAGLVFATTALSVRQAQADDHDEPLAEAVTLESETAAVTVAAQTQSDHRRMVRKFAVGFMGFSTMFLGDFGNQVTAPVIGGRYWMDQTLGIDAGIGFSMGGGSSEVEVGGTTTETDNPVPFAFILHAGVPLALADSQHFSFQVVPELNIGFSSVTDEATDTDFSGFHFDIGARAGGELHFGFIDVPQLSLQAGIAARFNVDSAGSENDTTTTSVSQTTLSTSVGDNPWDFFTANIAALYYFDS